MTRTPLIALACGLLLTLGLTDRSVAQIAGAGGFGGGLGGGAGGGVAGGLAGGVAGGGQAGGAAGGGAAGAAGGGILINTDGIVIPVFDANRNGPLQRKRMQALADEHLNDDVTKPSKLRKVSLVQLERACRPFAENGENVTLEMQNLAGLQRIDYVFVYPETNDLVIAGPAEGFAPDAVGRVVGVTTGHPTLRLDDLMVILRSVQRSGRLGCSIDPEPDRLARLQLWLKNNSTPSSVDVAQSRFVQMAEILGLQNVTLWGVPVDSHVAQALVEADYHMKLVSIGRESYRVRGFKSHLDILGRGSNSLQRWWFTPLYEALYQSDDGNAYQFEGQRLQLVAQEEVADERGNRTDAANTRVSTRRWAKLFTEKFPQLAEQSSSFGELQNLVDLSILAALMEKQGLRDRVGWEMSLFLDEARAPVLKAVAPKRVPSAFNYKMQGRSMVVGLVGGGVEISARAALTEDLLQPDGDRNLDALRKENLPLRGKVDGDADEIVWWWD